MTQSNERSNSREQALPGDGDEPLAQQDDAQPDSYPASATESGVPALTDNANPLPQDQSMDRSSAHPDSFPRAAREDTPEMDIDLGYAEYTEAYSEDEELDNFTSIDDLKSAHHDFDSVGELENSVENLESSIEDLRAIEDLEDFEEGETPTLTERVEDDYEFGLDSGPETDHRDAPSKPWQPTSGDPIQTDDIAKLEAIVFGEEEAPAVAEPAQPPEEQTSEPAAFSAIPSHKAGTKGPISPQVPLTAKGENPFLPKHIMERLNQGRNLVEEIAQSSAALDASTAILRTHARAERMHKSRYGESPRQDYNSSATTRSDRQRQALVDDLVEEYLPLVAAELRRRLNRMLDD